MKQLDAGIYRRQHRLYVNQISQKTIYSHDDKNSIPVFSFMSTSLKTTE
ncbi:MAG: hypothetical protein LBF33_02515 [Oscillospiraceae bacterium]|nr:hypothetical protein [Oscillospiraceae bacterium]